MEPRNIGVVLWHDGLVSARFIGERDDGSVVPPKRISVESAANYTDWIAHWRRLAEMEWIDVPEGRVERASPDFLNGMKAESRKNYLLADGGLLLDPVDNAESALSFLYSELVLSDADRHAEKHAATLRELCDKAVAQAGLSGRPDFKKRYPVTCHLAGGVVRQFRFSYGLGDGNGHTAGVIQRVQINDEASANSAAFMLECLGRFGNVPQGKRASLFNGNDCHDNPKADELVEMLQVYSVVVDVSSPEGAAAKLALLAA